MARENAALYAFNAGEVSKNALARVDVAKMRLAAQCQVNWMPWVIGPMMLRPGLMYVGETLSDAKTKLLPFVYSKTDTSLLELTANTLRVWINEVLLTRGTVATSVGDPDFSGTGAWSTSGTTAGCAATISGGTCTLTASAVGGTAMIAQTLSVASGDQGSEHGLHVVVTNGPVTLQIGSSAGGDDYLAQSALDTGTHSLAFTPTSGSAYLQIWSTDQWNKTLSEVTIETAGVVELPTPWGASDLPNLRVDQSGDVVYVACYGYQQYKIERRGTRPGARGFSVVLYRSGDGPFHEGADLANVSMTPAALYGNTTVTSSQPFFNTGHAGALIRLFSPGQNSMAPVGAVNAFTEAIQVSGVGTTRQFSINVSGTFSGSWTLQRSLIGADSGFAPIPSNDPGWTYPTSGATPNFSEAFSNSFCDVSLANTDDLEYDNVDAWYRIGFAANSSFTASIGPSSTVMQVTEVGAGVVTVGQALSGTGLTSDTVVATGAPGGGAGLYEVSNSQTVSSETITGASYTSGSATMGLSVNGGGWYGIARILSVNSPTEVTVEILSPFSSLLGTQLWQISDWCATFGWPTSVCFHEGRLWWFSGGEIPIAGGVSDDYVSYAEEDQYGNSLGDSGAILEDFGSGPSDSVNWGLSLTRLLLGREESIASARSSNFDQAMTGVSGGFVVRDCSDQGAMRLPAVKLGKRGIFVQQNNRKVYELAFNPSEFDYGDRDLTRLNLDIGVPGFVAIDYVVQPDRAVHLPRGDGMSAVLLYDVDDQVEAWWRVMTLGVIEDVCRLPCDGRAVPGETLEDLNYYVVNRTINGTTRRFIERLARRDQCVGATLNYQLDCAVAVSGSAASGGQVAQLPSTTISVWADGGYIGTAATDGSGNFTFPDGKDHSAYVAGLGGAVVLGAMVNPTANGQTPNQTFDAAQGTLTVGTQYNGCPAEVFADIAGTGRGLQHIGALTVSAGIVTLPNNQVASTIVACLGFVAPFMSAKLAYGAQMGSALTMKKKLDHVGLSLYDSAGAPAVGAGLLFGQRMDALDPLPQVEADQVTPGGTIWSELDTPAIELPGEWDTDARLCLLAQAPNPCMVGAAVIAEMTSEGASPLDRAPRFIGAPAA